MEPAFVGPLADERQEPRAEPLTLPVDAHGHVPDPEGVGVGPVGAERDRGEDGRVERPPGPFRRAREPFPVGPVEERVAEGVPFVGRTVRLEEDRLARRGHDELSGVREPPVVEPEPGAGRPPEQGGRRGHVGPADPRAYIPSDGTVDSLDRRDALPADSIRASVDGTVPVPNE